MTLSAAFTVEGDANPARHQVAYGSTVDLALNSTDGASSIVWRIMGCSDDEEPIPTITPSGNPSGKTASFVMPADSGDTLGRTFLVRCVVSTQIRGSDGAYEEDISYGVVGAVNSQGRLPIVPGEKNYRNGTHGWAPEINEVLNASGGGGGGGSGGGWTDDGAIVRLTTAGDSVAIGTATLSGTEKLRVIGNARFEQSASTSGNPKAFLVAGAGHTTLTASAEIIDVDFALNRTVQRGTGAVTTQRAFIVRAPTYGFVGASTVTDSATFAITDAPAAGTNATLTNTYALWVQAGGVRVGSFGAGVVQSSATGVLSSGTLSIANGGTGLTSAGGTPDRVLLTSNGTTFSVGQVTLASIVSLAGLSVLGRSASTTGVTAAITGTDGQAFRVSGTTLGFGTLATAAYADNSLTLAKLATQAALSVLVNATNATAVPTALASTTDGDVLQRSGTSLVWGAAPLGSGTVTYAKIQNGTGLSVIGRAANSAGVNADIVAGTDGNVLRRSGTAVGFGSLDLSAVGTVGSSLLGLANIGGASGNTGKALISNGTTWAAGTDFVSNNLTTTGDLLLGTAVASLGDIRAGSAFLVVATNLANDDIAGIIDWGTTATDTLYIGDSAYVTSIRSFSPLALEVDGVNRATLSASVFELVVAGARFKSTVATPVFQQETDATNSVVGDLFTINAQDASGTGATGGGLVVRAGDATGASGTRTGGDLTLRSGSGATAYGAVTINGGSGASALVITGRNSTNTTSLNILTWDATTNTAALGSTVATTNVTIAVSSASTLILRAGSSAAQVNLSASSGLALNVPFVWDASAVTPHIFQNTDLANTTTGDLFTINAQDALGTTAVTAGAMTVRAGDATGASGTRNGGALLLRSGTGATADGEVTIQRGTSTVFVTTSTSTGLSVGGTSRLSVSTSSTIDLNAIFLEFAATVSGPVIKQVATGTATVTGQPLTIQAQSCSGTTATIGGALNMAGGDATGVSGSRSGGLLILRSGTGATADGDVVIQRGTTYGIQLSKPSTGLVLGLLFATGVTSTQMPASTGDGVIYFGNATTAPSTGKPASGNILWSDNTTNADSWLSKNPSGGVWSQSPQKNWHRYYRTGNGTTNSTSSTTVATIGMGGFGDGGGEVVARVVSRDASNSFGMVVYGFSFIVQGGTLSSGTTTPTALHGNNSQVSAVALAYPGSNNIDFKVTATDGVTYTHEVMFEITFHPNSA